MHQSSSCTWLLLRKVRWIFVSLFSMKPLHFQTHNSGSGSSSNGAAAGFEDHRKKHLVLVCSQLEITCLVIEHLDTKVLEKMSPYELYEAHKWLYWEHIPYMWCWVEWCKIYQTTYQSPILGKIYLSYINQQGCTRFTSPTREKKRNKLRTRKRHYANFFSEAAMTKIHLGVRLTERLIASSCNDKEATHNDQHGRKGEVSW